MDYGKHFKDRMTQAEIDSALMAKMEADQREIARLRDELAEARRQVCDGVVIVHPNGVREPRCGSAQMMSELAAVQAREAKLREALSKAIETTYSDTLFAQWKSLLALPHDDSALKERLRQEREACAKVCDDDEHKYETGRSCAVAIRNLGDE